jgi:predicted GNAT family acetyltransferase
VSGVTAPLADSANMQPLISDNPDQQQFEARVADQLAGVAVYALTEPVIVFIHTEVDPVYEGEGIGGALAREALDDARRRGLTVIVECPFMRAWIERHSDYAELLR